ncbi:hypothetical protein TNCT_735781 [Trichonephila clavata]|uniref:Uncharacterized protein n=1 Tax=Trichonephila clavata TaxID=2740835 RepID=A0A8X6H538_TRICU|nr:hypothetical protein TNCT_735781 [Trichonephila clavata]
MSRLIPRYLDKDPCLRGSPLYSMWKRCCLVDRVKSWETVFSTLTSVLMVLTHVVGLSGELFKASSKERMLLFMAQIITSSAKKRQETPETF